jgi:hypothetical protein
LRDSIKVHVADIEKKYGISNMKAIIQFSVSDEFKDMLFEQYKVANYYQKIVIPFLRLKYGG